MGQAKKSDFILSIVEGNESFKTTRHSLWMILQKVNWTALKRGQRGNEAGYKLGSFHSGPDAEVRGMNRFGLYCGWIIGRTY